jgi:hypothetical protein
VKRSQTSVEVIILMSFFMIVLLIVLAINIDLGSFFQAKGSRDKLANSLDLIVQTSEFVFSQGVGAQNEIFITLPSIYNSSIENNTISFVLYSPDMTNVSRRLPFNVTGAVPNSSGTYKLRIAAITSGVNISVQ